MYSISPNIDKNKVFLIDKSEIRDRIDPIYFKSVNELRIANKTTFKLKKLSEVAEMQRGRFGHRPRNDPKFYGGVYPFIQTGDVVRASVEGGKIQYSQTLNELGLQTSRLFDKPVMVITIAANIGDTAILDYPACFPDSLIGISPKDNNTLNLYYLNVYFKFLKNYLNELAPQAAQKNINYQQLGPTPIVIPPIAIQKEVASIYFNAFEQKKSKEQEAKSLLESIDKYLLSELGIILPERDNSFSNRVFEVKWSELFGDRLDSEFSQVYFREISKSLLNGKYTATKLKEVTSFIESGSRPKGGVGRITSGVFSIGGEHVNDKCQVGIGKPKYIPLEFHEKIKLTETKMHDIVLVKDGATTGKIGIIDSEDFVNQNINEHVFLIRPETSIISPQYLVSFLYSSIGQILLKRFITGATVTGLTKESLRNILIPLPPLEVQNQITEHIFEVREKAKQLEAEAKNVLKEAKSKIEKMIIG